MATMIATVRPARAPAAMAVAGPAARTAPAAQIARPLSSNASAMSGSSVTLSGPLRRSGVRGMQVSAGGGFGKNLPQKKVKKAKKPANLDGSGKDPDGYPMMSDDEEGDLFNVLVKKAGILGGTWKGLATMKVPPGSNKKESTQIAKASLIQRKDQVTREAIRLYPKFEGEKLECAVQPEKDPMGDMVDLEIVPPEGTPQFPALIAYLKEGKNMRGF